MVTVFTKHNQTAPYHDTLQQTIFRTRFREQLKTLGKCCLLLRCGIIMHTNQNYNFSQSSFSIVQVHDDCLMVMGASACENECACVRVCVCVCVCMHMCLPVCLLVCLTSDPLVLNAYGQFS